MDTCAQREYDIARSYDLAMSRERDPSILRVLQKLKKYEVNNACGMRTNEIAVGFAVTALTGSLDKRSMKLLSSEYPVESRTLSTLTGRWMVARPERPSGFSVDWNKFAAQEQAVRVQALREVAADIQDAGALAFISSIADFNAMTPCDTARISRRILLLAEFAVLKPAARDELRLLELTSVSLEKDILRLPNWADCWPEGAQVSLTASIPFNKFRLWLAMQGVNLRDGPRADYSIDISQEDGLLVSDLVDLYNLGDYPSTREYIARKIITYNLTAKPGVEILHEVDEQQLKEQRLFRSSVLSKRLSGSIMTCILPTLSNMGLNYVLQNKGDIYTYDPSAAQ